MANGIISRVRKVPWSEITEILGGFGWELDADRKDLKRYRRSLQTIIAKKVAKNKWKIEYFIGHRLADSAGIADEEFAKVLLSELAIIHRLAP